MHTGAGTVILQGLTATSSGKYVKLPDQFYQGIHIGLSAWDKWGEKVRDVWLCVLDLVVRFVEARISVLWGCRRITQPTGEATVRLLTRLRQTHPVIDDTVSRCPSPSSAPHFDALNEIPTFAHVLQLSDRENVERNAALKEALEQLDPRPAAVYAT